ncbi:MAG: hypothetical protein HY832_00030 [Candidatus Aenigmarchaeota archaeon]|nr:hypothetical protein [Candidatus Aenigmarchaeota archaeon]
MKYLIVISLVALLIIAGCTGTTVPVQKTPTTPNGNTPSIGTPTWAKPVVAKFLTMQILKYGVVDATGLPVDAGNEVFVVDLKVANTAAPEAEKYPYYFDEGFELKVGDGLTYPYDPALTKAYVQKQGTGFALVEGTALSKEADITGSVAFQLPADSVIKYFVYDDKQGGSIVLVSLPKE